MHFPTKVCICILRDGTKIYKDIASEEELEELYQTMKKTKNLSGTISLSIIRNIFYFGT